MKINLCVFAAICCLLLSPLSLYAQDAPITSTITAPTITAPTITAPIITAPIITADDVNRIASELWCPLCSGIRLDACELQACEQMREEIALKLEAGQTLESIQTDFVAKYGPQVMGEPPKDGFNLLAWLLPVVALAAGAVVLVTVSRQLLAKPQPATAISSHKDPIIDPYERRLDEELAKIE